MKKIFLIFIFALFLFSFVSADVLLGQTNKVYNLGETFQTSATIKSNVDVSGILNTYLICGGIKRSVYPILYLTISKGTSKNEPVDFPLQKSVIGNQIGNCFVQVNYSNSLTNSQTFKISNKLNLNISLSKKSVKPQEQIEIKGIALREDGEPSDGFLRMTIKEDNKNLTQPINKGRFDFEFSFPKGTSSKDYTINFFGYEKDSGGTITNTGTFSSSVFVKQVPTNLEIITNNKEVEPGTNLKMKVILHDQSGKNINSSVGIRISKDSKLLFENTIETGKSLNVSIRNNESSGIWTINATSGYFNEESQFNITKKEMINAKILNRTIVITNTGNVPYNRSIEIHVGNSTIPFDLGTLQVGAEKRYVLSAPEGEYTINISSEGDQILTKSTFLTGNVISVKEVSQGVVKVASSPIAWIFIILIFSFAGFIIFKKGYRKSFIGRVHLKKKKKSIIHHSEKDKLLDLRNQAQLSLSISGNKQDVNLLCLKIKNFTKVHFEDGPVKDTLNKITQIAEGKKSYIYRNEGYIFFILAPVETKTFQNEKASLDISQEIEQRLKKHNRLFKQKIDYGFSIVYGTMVIELVGGIMKFAALGNLMSESKRLAGFSRGETLLNTRMNTRVLSFAKTQKHKKDGFEIYSITEMKNNEKYKDFLDNFKRRMESA